MLDLGNTVWGKAARGMLRWVPCVRIAEVRGSNPLSSTSNNALPRQQFHTGDDLAGEMAAG
jgi:hypothetical protein